MKIAITTTTWNRSKKFKDLCVCLNQTEPSGAIVKWFVRDDRSLEPIQSVYQTVGLDKTFVKNNVRLGADLNTLYCMEDSLKWNPDLIINIDSDSLLKPHWLKSYIKAWEMPGFGIIAGFNSPFHNKTKDPENGIMFKDTAPGLSMSFRPSLFIEANLKPKHNASWGKTTSWDYELGKVAKAKGLMIGCIIPSVVQHQAGDGLHRTKDDYARDW